MFHKHKHPEKFRFQLTIHRLEHFTPQDSRVAKDYAIYWKRGNKRSASTKMEKYSNNKIDWHQDFEFTGTLYRNKDHYRRKLLKFELHQIEHESKKQMVIGRAAIDLGLLAKEGLVVNETQHVEMQLSQKVKCALVISIAATPQSLIKESFGGDIMSAMSTLTDATDVDSHADLDLETDTGTPLTAHSLNRMDSREIITFTNHSNTTSKTDSSAALVHELQNKVAQLTDELDLTQRKRRDETSVIAKNLAQAQKERDEAQSQMEKFKILYEYEKGNAQELKNTGEKLKKRSEEVTDNLKWLEIENTNFREQLEELESQRRKFDADLAAESARLQAKIDEYDDTNAQMERKIQQQQIVIDKLKEDAKALALRKDEHIHELQAKLKEEQESAIRLQEALDAARKDVSRAIAENASNDDEKETLRKNMKKELQTLGDKYTQLHDTYEREHKELESLRAKVRKYREDIQQLQTRLGTSQQAVANAQIESQAHQRKIEANERSINELKQQKAQLEEVLEAYTQQKKDLDTYRASLNALTQKNAMYKEENEQLTKKLVETVKFFEKSSKEQNQKTKEEIQKEKQMLQQLEQSNQELKAKIQSLGEVQVTVTQLKKQRTQLEDKLAEVQTENQSLRTQREKDTKEHTTRVNDLTARFQSLQHESTEMNQKISSLEQENAALRTSQHSNEQRLQELTSQIASLGASNTSQKAQITKLQSDIDSLNTDKSSQAEKLEQLNKTAATLEFQVAERDRAIAQLRDENAELREELAGKHKDENAHLESLKSKVDTLKSERRELEETIATLQQGNRLIRDEMEGDLSVLRGTITTLQGRNAELEQKIASLLQKNKSLLEEQAEIKKKSLATVQDYEQRISEAQKERDATKQDLTRAQRENQELRTDLSSIRHSHGTEINDLTQKLDSLRRDMEKQSETLKTLHDEREMLLQARDNEAQLREQEVSEARNSIQSLSATKALLEKELSQLQEENFSLKKAKEPKEHTIMMPVAVLQREREEHRSRVAELQKEINTLRATPPAGSSTKQNPQELQQENKTLRDENTKLQQRIADTIKTSEEASRKLKDKLRTLQQQIADLSLQEQETAGDNAQIRAQLNQAKEQITYLENQQTRVQHELEETKKQAEYAAVYREELEQLKSRWTYAQEDFAIFAVLNKYVLHNTLYTYKGDHPVAGVELTRALEENDALTRASPFLQNALTSLEFVALTKSANLEQMVYWFSTSIHLLKWLRGASSMSSTIDKEIATIYKYDREHLEISSKAPLTESPVFVSRQKDAPGFSRSYQNSLSDYARKSVELAALSFYRMLGCAFDEVKPVLDDILNSDKDNVSIEDGQPEGKRIVKELEYVDAVMCTHIPPIIKENAQVILINLLDQYIFRAMVTGRASLSAEKAILIKMIVETVQEDFVQNDANLQHLDEVFRWTKEACNVVSLQMRDMQGDVKSVVCPNLTDEQIQFLLDASEGQRQTHPASYSPPRISLASMVHVGKSEEKPLFAVENLRQ